MPDRTSGAAAHRPVALHPKRSADAEWDQLATALNELGVAHIAPGRVPRSGVPATVRELFRRLLTSKDARLHQASIVLLLTRPEMADEARATIRQFTGLTLDRAMRRYVAAAAMQRIARTRIAMQLGPQPDLPADFLDELALPSLDDEYGRAALFKLASQEEALYGYDAWGTYRSLLDLFLAESRRTDWGHSLNHQQVKPCASEPIAHA